MPESKNNFLKSKMNKDLDERLIPKGEYRNAQNINISRSEGEGVGTMQNILGNNSISTLGITAENVEIIGYIVDQVTETIYIFATNYTDSSPTRLTNFASQYSFCSIISYNIKTGSSLRLLEGKFLNFSKTHPITGINLVENLLFWTDNRNQPRKINIQNAINEPLSYYISEDQISVAKFYPSLPLEFYKQINYNTTNSGVVSTSMELNDIEGLEIGMMVTDIATPSWKGTWISNIFDGAPFLGVVLSSPQSWSNDANITFTEYGLNDCTSEYLPPEFVTTLTAIDVAAGEYEVEIPYQFNAGGFNDMTGFHVYTLGENELVLPLNSGAYISSVSGANNEDIVISLPESPSVPPDLDGMRIAVVNDNPKYDPNFPGDKEYLKDKFLRFSYRFKFDDGEYSLIAPFTQIGFIPTNDGYFILNAEEKAGKSSVVNFMENKVNCIDLSIYPPYDFDKNRGYPSWDGGGGILNRLKITNVEIVGKFSNDSTIKVFDSLDIPEILDIEGAQGVLTYKYQSRKPIRVLPESEIVRTSDKVPVRALSQEVTGNRVVYGNYYDKHTSPDHLEYKVSTGPKVDLANTQTKRNLINHQLKENRNYQVGIKLSDRYGRASDVILSSLVEGQFVPSFTPSIFGGSTVYNSFGSPEKFSATDILDWTGDQLLVYLNEQIPSEINKPGYPGIYDPINNPLGWYSYQIVVQQQQQEYYNVYLPGISKPDDLDYNYEYKKSYFSLVNDNINKVPKDLTSIGPDDKEFRSSVELYPRVNPTKLSIITPKENYVIFPTRQSDEIESLIYNAYVSPDGTGVATIDGLEIPPLRLYKGNSATLATVNTNQVIGFDLSSSDFESHKILGVFETNPVESVLDIFYETSTSGFISDLNEQISEGSFGPVSIATNNFEMFENSKDEIICVFEIFDNVGGLILDPTATAVLNSVYSTNAPSTNIASQFLVEPQIDSGTGVETGRFTIKNLSYFYWGTSGQQFTFNFSITANTETANSLGLIGNLSNIRPQYGQKVCPGYLPYTGEDKKIPLLDGFLTWSPLTDQAVSPVSSPLNVNYGYTRSGGVPSSTSFGQICYPLINPAVAGDAVNNGSTDMTGMPAMYYGTVSTPKADPTSFGTDASLSYYTWQNGFLGCDFPLGSAFYPFIPSPAQQAVFPVPDVITTPFCFLDFGKDIWITKIPGAGDSVPGPPGSGGWNLPIRQEWTNQWCNGINGKIPFVNGTLKAGEEQNDLRYYIDFSFAQINGMMNNGAGSPPLDPADYTSIKALFDEVLTVDELTGVLSFDMQKHFDYFYNPLRGTGPSSIWNGKYNTYGNDTDSSGNLTAENGFTTLKFTIRVVDGGGFGGGLFTEVEQLVSCIC